MFEELSSSDPKTKYGAAKAILGQAKTDPASLYPHAKFFEDLLECDNNILKWTAIDVVGSLAAVDTEARIAKNTGRLVSFLSAGKMITANHAIAALARFAQAYPRRREAITGELMKVERCEYDTEECRNIALGNVVLALDSYFDDIRDKQGVVAFVERQTANSRNATAKKARAFLKKHTSSKPA